MSEAFIIDAVRTPVGKKGGTLAGVHPADLGAHVLKALVARTGIDPAAVEDVVMGCVDMIGPQAGDVVETAHHDTVFFALLEEGRGFVDDGLAVFAELPRADREHREHQVSNGGVQSVVVQAGHENYRATEVSTAWIVLVAARPAAPMHAGTPIPSR